MTTTDTTVRTPKIEYKSDEADPFIDECPDWCIHKGTHRSELHEDDRRHDGDLFIVPIRGLKGEAYSYDEDGASVFVLSLGHTRMYLSRQSLVRDPVIRVGLNDSSTSVDLSIGEAEKIAAALMTMVEAAR